MACVSTCLCGCQQTSCGCKGTRPRRVAPSCSLCEGPVLRIVARSPLGRVIQVVLCTTCDVRKERVAS